MGSSDFFEPTRAATLLGGSFSAAPAGRLPLEWTCPARIAAKIMRERSWLRKDLMVEGFLLRQFFNVGARAYFAGEKRSLWEQSLRPIVVAPSL